MARGRRWWGWVALWDRFASRWVTWKSVRGCRDAVSFLNSTEDWEAVFGSVLVERPQGRSPLDQRAQSQEG